MHISAVDPPRLRNKWMHTFQQTSSKSNTQQLHHNSNQIGRSPRRDNIDHEAQKLTKLNKSSSKTTKGEFNK